MGTTDEPLEESTTWQTRSTTRVTILDALSTEPHDRADLQSLTDISETTCDQLLEDAERKDWIRYDGAQYQITPVGELMAAHLEALLNFFEAISRDQTVIEDYTDRLIDIETALGEIENASATRNSQITHLEQHLDQKAEHEDIKHLQEAIESDSEQWRDSREQVNELSQTIKEIDKRLDRIEHQQQAIQTALAEAEARDEELRTELTQVREMAEYAVKDTNRGLVDRLSGR